MRKYVVFPIICAMIFVSCQQKNSRSTVDGSKKEKAVLPVRKHLQHYANPLLNEYEAFINSLDTTVVETSCKAAKQYNVLFKSATQATCDTAFVIFSKYYDRLTNSLNELHQKDTSNFDYFIYSQASKPSVLTPKMALFHKNLKVNGFDILEEEGISYIGQDRNFISKWFYGLVSATMKEFLTQLNLENKEQLDNDAAIVISSHKLVDRAIWWENFTKRHPDFVYSDVAIPNKRMYLSILLTGSDNTPVTDYENNQLTDYFRSAYTYIEYKYPFSDAAKEISPYFHLLLEKNKSGADSLFKIYKEKRLVD